MRWRSPALTLACLGLAAAWGCGPQPDLKTLKLVPGISGYYDDGVVQSGPDKGQNRLLPSVTFQLKNEGDQPFTYVDLITAYWRVAVDDGEKDSKVIQGIGGTPLEPGATSPSITVRSSVGYTSAHARAEFFFHSQFIDFKVRVFAKQSGRTVSLGELAVERRLLPAVPKDGSRP
jgi:hypothetical protein